MTEPLDVTPVIRQRLAWDICDCDEIDELWGALNLVRPSEDVAETAHLESHTRMSQIKPLQHLGDFYVGLSADIISGIMRYHFEKNGGDKLTDVQKSVMLGQNIEIIRGSLYPILAALMESGLITFGPAAYNDDAAVRI